MCTPANISRLENEYELLANNHLPGLLKPIALERKGLALLMEDPGGEPLDAYQPPPGMEIQRILEISIQLAASLAGIHNHGIIHGELNADSILIDSSDGQAWLAGCGAAVSMLGGAGNSWFQGRIAGTLAYMAPEQSGRMTGGADERSDFYSLGVIMYKLLCGRLPFEAENPLQWIDAHMNRQAASPDSVNPEIPAALSALVMKLMAKNPGDRYQSPLVLIADLKECQRQWKETGEITPFALGKGDIAGDITSAKRLYGRSREIGIIQQVYREVCDNGKNQMILVSGPSGTGKTVLVTESLKRMAESRGCFISGKYDSLEHNAPYLPLARALSRLMKRLSSAAPTMAEYWKESISTALGSLASVVAGPVPEAELLTGPRSSIEKLGPQETGRRFLYAIRQLLKAISGKEHPAVVFIDDIHWAEPASLHLLRSICEDEQISHLLIIGAYNEREGAVNSHLQELLPPDGSMKRPVTKIELHGLNHEDSWRFVADALAASEKRVQPLTDLLYSKSAGNPFFLGQMLQQAAHDQAMHFSSERGAWEWDREAIKALPGDEIDGSIVFRRLFALPPECNAFLNLAACIGSCFELPLLARISGKSLDETRRIIDPAIREGLIIEADSGADGKIELGGSGGHDQSSCEFVHDRIHQAAYMLVSEEQKPALHLKIGRTLMLMAADNIQGIQMPIIVDHMNRGRGLVDDALERLELARGNLLAGQQSLEYGAHDSSLHYTSVGMELLPDNCWDEHYKLAYQLYLAGAQSAYLCGHAEKAEDLFISLLERARGEVEKADILSQKMILLSGSGHNQEAIDIGLKVLGSLGMKLKLHPPKADFVKESTLIRWRLRNQKAERLVERLKSEEFEMHDDPLQLKLAENMVLAGKCAYQANPGLYAMLTMKMANMALKDGNNRFAGIGYACSAYICENVLYDLPNARKCKQAAVMHAEKYGNEMVNYIVAFMMGALMHHWSGSALEGVVYLDKCINLAKEAGELLIPGEAYIFDIENSWISGCRLALLREKCWEAMGFFRSNQRDMEMSNAGMYRELFELLQGCTEATGFGKDDTRPIAWEGCHRGKWIALFCRMIWNYMIGEWQEALACYEKIAGERESTREFLVGTEFDLYSALILSRACASASASQRKSYRKDIRKILDSLEKQALECPANFQHLCDLVEAETARLDGDSQKAEAAFDRAIKAAGAQGIDHHFALASELAASHYHSVGRDGIARLYLREAWHAYEAWGAYGKLRQLEQAHPEWLKDLT